MICRQRIIFFWMAVAALGAACSSKKEVAKARKSLYDTEFTVVYNAALDATRKMYPNLSDNPGTGAIKTAWHQVQYANTQDDLANQRTIAQGQGLGTTSSLSPAARAAGMPTRLAYKRFFIRFDIVVGGGRPWRVKVVGHASEWEPGAAMPNELVGAAKPHWLEGRTDALTLAIYKKIKPFAVPMVETEVPKPEDAVPRTDPKGFKGIPDAAGARLAQLRDALVRRNLGSLRDQLHDDVVWSLGADPGADTAMAMWQADPETLDAMVRVIGAGCAGVGKRVACPIDEPKPGDWRLVLEQRGELWKVSSFVRVE